MHLQSYPSTLITKRKLPDGGNSVLPSSYAAGSSNQNDHKMDNAHQQQTKCPAPYDNQQQSAPCKICENTYCETLIGHIKADCLSHGGGKSGKYPENFCGKRDIHLSPEARIVAHWKNALEGKANEHFSGLADYAEDLDEDIKNVIRTVEDDFAFMSMLPDEESDEITIDEEIKVNTISVCRSSWLDWKYDWNQTEPNRKRPDHRLRLHWSQKFLVASPKVWWKLERLMKTGCNRSFTYVWSTLRTT